MRAGRFVGGRLLPRLGVLQKLHVGAFIRGAELRRELRDGVSDELSGWDPRRRFSGA